MFEDVGNGDSSLRQFAHINNAIKHSIPWGVSKLMIFERVTTSSPQYLSAVKLRNEVLRLPLGLDLADEDLTDEVHDSHYCLHEAQELLAYVLIVRNSKTSVTLRQMCVKPGKQKQGIGTRLVRQVEAELKKLGILSISMAARASAISFYEKLGYDVVGEEFSSVGIPHVRMCKLLNRE